MEVFQNKCFRGYHVAINTTQSKICVTGNFFYCITVLYCIFPKKFLIHPKLTFKKHMK